MLTDCVESSFVGGVTGLMEKAGVAEAGLFLLREGTVFEVVVTGDLSKCRSALEGEMTMRASKPAWNGASRQKATRCSSADCIQ